MNSNLKFLLGLLLAAYALFLLALVAWLSHYPWPVTQPGPVIQTEFAAPPDFKAIKDIPQRKKAFFSYLRPMVRTVNQRITTNRTAVQRMHNQLSQGKTLTDTQSAQLSEWAEYYSVSAETPLEATIELLARMNRIPASLALAQAASESAWGTSRFARTANNYFGQWCFSQGCGVIPKRRPEGASHEVARFDSPYESVDAYFKNLNTNHAYQSLRDIRQKLAAQDKPITAQALLPGLMSYSERGEDYLHDLSAIIRQNNLE